MTKYWSELLSNMPADCDYKLNRYGEKLRINKEILYNACIDKGIAPAHYALLLSMAMLETTHLTADQRDTSKDKCTDGSANVSLFNLSVDLVKKLGYTKPISMNKNNICELNYVHTIPCVVDLLQRGIKEWGVERLLNYVRGGYTAFMDGKSYDVYTYKNSIATMLKVIDMHPELLRDDRRIDIYLKHV